MGVIAVARSKRGGGDPVSGIIGVDEFGVGDVPASRLVYLGGAQRFSTGDTLNLIRMGVRLYDPALGRFLQVDPVEGGCSNAYAYVYGDPVNDQDLNGMISWKKMGCGVQKWGTRAGQTLGVVVVSTDVVYDGEAGDQIP